jgi:hypothetical protein
MPIPHFEKVDCPNIIAEFTADKLHRSCLTIPFKNRNSGKQLCIIGQNPSDANEHHADKTIRYLEELVFRKYPKYSSIIMLNLYSRIDTQKQEIADLERPETIDILSKTIKNYTDFLLVYGASKKDGKYDFHQKYEDLKPLLKGKNVFKIDTKTNTNYPPHPGNPKIFYRNFEYGITRI